MREPVVFHEQALKDWGAVMSAGVFAPEPFLLASIIPLCVLEAGGKREVYVDRHILEMFVKDQSVLQRGIALLEGAGMVEVEAGRLVLGKRKGLLGVSYTVLAGAAPQASSPPPAATHTGKGTLVTMADLEELRTQLGVYFSGYEKEMLDVYKQTQGPAEVRGVVQKSLQVATSGGEYTPTLLLRYFNALVTMKQLLKVVPGRFSLKEQGQAAQLLKLHPTHQLVEMVPYFVFTYCDESDDWHVATFSNLISQRSKVLAKFNKKGGNNGGRKTGTFV